MWVQANDPHRRDMEIKMPPASTDRGSAYLNALAIEIDKKLQRALASASQRRNLMQELFADVALEVDDRAIDIIFCEEGSISVADDGYRGPICFYDVLADHFVRMPQNGKSIIDLIVQLWSQSFASSIFSLLFHKWLFEVQLDNPEVLLRYCSALIEGATNVFWIDIQTNARRFQSLFRYLLEEVALDSERLKKIPLQAQRDLFLLLTRFIFFYNSADKLESFLKWFPDFPNAFLIGGASDVFVMELADQLQKLKVEPVLLHYLSQIKVLQGMELRMTTSTRLKTSLYSFTSPGGPMYPTRAVRHAAWDTLDFLFPVGQYPRHLISLFFRLLYPWTSSTLSPHCSKRRWLVWVYFDAIEVVLKVLTDGLETVHVLYSYRFAIILLTVLVKVATLPLTKQQVESAMQNLQPKIKAIQQRYAGNQERIQLEASRLYSQAGVNPLAGTFGSMGKR